MVADHFKLLNSIKSSLQTILIPLKGQSYRAYLDVKKKVSQKEKNIESVILQKKIEHLQQENVLLKIDLQVLQKENKEVRRLLQAPLPLDWRFLPAQVLSEKEGILQINIGANLEVNQGDIVVVGSKKRKRGGILVGKVIKVEPAVSLVQTPIARGVEIPAKILANNERGMVIFLPDKGLTLDKVLQKVFLEKEQIVITSGEADFLPNLLIGIINQIEKNEVEVYQKAILSPLVDYHALETVFVVKQ